MVAPGAVGGQGIFSGAQLVDPTCHELPQPHEGVSENAGVVVLVGGCEVLGCPLLEEHGLGSPWENIVGVSHKLSGQDV